MSSPASPHGKGGRLWKALLLPLLLPLLITGSWALPEAQHLHRVAGQTLSVTCQYPPKGWPYERKGWCKELSAFKCTRLVTSSGPRRLVQSSRFSIWDNPSTGLFIVTMTGLKEEDSGHYWCRIYHTSSNSVSKSIRFYLAVSPAPITFPEVTFHQPPSRALSTAPASTQAIRASAELVSSPTQSSVPPTGRAKEAPRASSAVTTLSPQQNSTLHSHPAAPSALAPVLCVLLVAKGLALTVLTVHAEDFPALPPPKIQAHQLLTRNWLLGQHHPVSGTFCTLYRLRLQYRPRPPGGGAGPQCPSAHTQTP
ncbi:natural cytotoxicity triggering receptor 2 [Enhydra lutris kenyoni]|uniref:Natural cytotoxicity triggering receptor 2 n=1 Tax=Enhydra lutris kenyoni TaxID=391180 RepID=A0A2Y9JGD1_ENHLU|nr:natural cytotoxicity triggering receptor 2 [Enhydra lutris kenyoni]